MRIKFEKTNSQPEKHPSLDEVEPAGEGSQNRDSSAAKRTLFDSYFPDRACERGDLFKP